MSHERVKVQRNLENETDRERTKEKERERKRKGERKKQREREIVQESLFKNSLKLFSDSTTQLKVQIVMRGKFEIHR